MNANFKSTRGLAAAMLVIGIALSGCTTLSTTPSPTLQQKIEAARTPSDHNALADHYVKEAAAARARAAEHRQMAQTYRAAPPGGRESGSMPAHCLSTASSYDTIAARFDDMATGHRQMATQAKP